MHDVSSNTLNTIRPPLPARRRRCRVHATRLYVRVWRRSLVCRRHCTPLPPPNPLPPPVPRYAVACSTICPRNPFCASPPPILRHFAAPLTDAATPVPPCASMPASATYLSSLLVQLYPFPLSRLDSIPARQTMEGFFSLCRKLPIALYLGCSTLNAGRPSSAPLQALSLWRLLLREFTFGVLGAEEVRAGERKERRRGERGRSLAWRGSSHVQVFLLGNLVVPGEKGTKRSLTKWLNRGASGKGKAKAQTTTDTGRFIENVDGPSTKQ
ncbi:hypothetical protein B0H14DRAFT_3903618 [Mycena olivaceomarginata]|nr:hypothetical protein B0H14DRAFT_3903618 [Mycena olivaceomarginata]